MTAGVMTSGEEDSPAARGKEALTAVSENRGDLAAGSLTESSPQTKKYLVLRRPRRDSSHEDLFIELFINPCGTSSTPS